MDIYSLLTGDDDDAQLKAAALSAALRKQNTIGLLAQLTGDKVLAPVGGGMIQQAAQGEQEISQAGRARQELKLRRDDAAAQERRFNTQMGMEGQRLQLEKERLGQDAFDIQGIPGTGKALKFNKKTGKTEVIDTGIVPPKGGKPSSEIAADLRKEFLGNQVVKDTQQVASAYKKMTTADPTPAGDMSLIYGYMKLQDPTSSVREGEYATAANAGGIPDRIRTAYNNAIKGDGLAAAMREDFKKQARNIYQAQVSRAEPLRKEYHRLAEGVGLDPKDVVIDLGFDDANGSPLDHFKSQLQQGERLVVTPRGEMAAIGANEPLPPGFKEAQ